MAQLLPNGKQTFLDQNGAPLASGYVWFYIPNTTTPKNTWQDSAQTILNLNPVPLDAAGRAIIYGSGVYRQQVYDVNNNLIWDQLTASPASSADLGNTGVPGGAGLIGFDGTTLDQQFLSRVDRVVDSIAALRALAHTTYTRVHVTGYYSAGDHGGGFYWYDSSDTVTADNGGTVIVANDTARWKLEYKDTVSIGQFGAKCDSTTDDTASVAAAFASGALNVTVPGFAKLSSTVSVPNNITISGINGKNCGFVPSTASVTLFSKTSAAVFTDGFCTFEGLTFDGKGLASIGGIVFTLCHRTAVKNCIFIGITTPLTIDRGYYHQVHNNYLTPGPSVRTGGFTFTSTLDSDHIFFVDCRGNQHYNNGAGHVVGGANFYVRRAIDCDFTNNQTFALTNGTDIAYWMIVENDCQNVRVTASCVENSTSAVIVRNGSGVTAPPQNTVFANCGFDQAYGGHIQHQGGAFTRFVGCNFTSSGIGTNQASVSITGGGAVGFAECLFQGQSAGTTGCAISVANCAALTVANCNIDSCYNGITYGATVTLADVHDNSYLNSTGGTSTAGAVSGIGNRLSANRGFAKPGLLSAAVPGSGVTITNTFGYDATLYLAGGTVTQVNIDGVNLGGTTTAISSYDLNVGSTYTLTYSVAPVVTLVGKP